MSSGEIFDEIYLNGCWGYDENGSGTSGRGSHSAELVDPYIEATKSLIKHAKARIFVDMGCGDFNVGSMIFPFASRYIATDVSKVVLAKNIEKYKDSRISFVHHSITETGLPCGDIGTIRQVLQHLDNKSIQKFVTNLIIEKPFPLLLVTEHVPVGEFFPNSEKPIGSDTRVPQRSGVVLHLDPFNLPYKKKERILQVSAGRNTIIESTLYLL